MQLFVQQLFTNPTEGFSWLILIVFSICLHEFFHAAVALREGDRTAVEAGHLTMNPFKQMGIMSLMMLLVAGIAWGAVPVNPARMRSKWSHMRVAFAGPFANLMLAAIFGLLAAVMTVFLKEAFPNEMNHDTLFNFFVLGSFLNTTLFILNMVPCYPLDGWTIAGALLPLKKIPAETLSIISVAVLILIFSCSHYLMAAGLAVTQFLIRRFSDWLIYLTGVFA